MAPARVPRMFRPPEVSVVWLGTRAIVVENDWLAAEEMLTAHIVAATNAPKEIPRAPPAAAPRLIHSPATSSNHHHQKSLKLAPNRERPEFTF